MKFRILALAAAFLFSIPLSACGDPLLPNAEDRASPAPELPSEAEIPADPPAKPQEEHGETPDPEIPAETESLRVLVDGLNIRSGAGIGFPVLGQAQKGVLLPLSREKDGWYETFFRGQTAYVSADARYTAPFSVPAAEEEIERVIEWGMKLSGTPYVYGAVRLHDGKGNFLRGFTDEKFDCSSLMQYIFYEGAGILLDVTTRTQVLQGIAVAREDLKRGDLMFFTNSSRRNKSGIERVGHVGLYLGNNYILHTASDFAKAEELSAARWSNFLCARRMP